MRKRIFIYYMILITIGVSVTGFLISRFAHQIYKQEVEDKLKSAVLLIQHDITTAKLYGASPDYDKLAHDYSTLLNKGISADNQITGSMRITFVDFDGNVAGESESNYRSMENHLKRQEIVEAINGNIGKDIRFSTTMGIDHLYVAVSVQSSRIVARVSVPLTQLKTIDNIISLYSLAGILVGLVLTALLALGFSKAITAPVKELIKASKDIASGNYSKRVQSASADEMGQLAETFNVMASKLEKTMSELTDKNVKLNSIIDSMISGIIAVDQNYKVILINTMAYEIFGLEQKVDVVGTNIINIIRNNQINTFLSGSIEGGISLVNEINISNPEEKILRIYTNPIRPVDGSATHLGGIIFIQDITNIRKLELIRTEFVSNVTHELKTPLTSIRGFIETLRSGAIDDKDVAERFLEIVDIEAERLYILINDILQLSEIENKQKDSNVGSYNLKTIIEQTVSILHGVAEKKNIQLITHVDEDLTIIANRDRIKQMLINLIDNAIKYNVESGSVYINATGKEGKIVISIKDTGIGIASEHISRIFERFYRVDKGRSRNMGGTGLGLSIVKHIVNLYSGEITVNSTPGKGTEFIIRLPVS